MRCLPARVFSVLVLLACAPVWAQTGALDPSFGTNGVVTTDLGPRDDVGRALLLQPDGRIVVAGYAESDAGSTFDVVRYTAGGALDAQFGTGGTVRLPFGSGTHRAYAVALQPDGKLVVAGQVENGTADVGLVRLHADGTPDATFGTDGRVVTDFGGGLDEAAAVLVQPDGRIVVGGSTGLDDSAGFALARYTPDGSLDPSFGTGGRVTTDAEVGVGHLTALLLQPDGRLVAVGTAAAGGSTAFALVRFLSDGRLDAGFGAEGLSVTSLGPLDDTATTAALQPDGRIVVGGYTRNVEGSIFAFALARYLTDGTPDPTFGAGGVATTAFPDGFAAIYRLALQPDGQAVATGPVRVNRPGGTSEAIALARYTTAGALDATFGTGGTATVQFGRFVDTPHDVALQPDGRIVVAGSTYVGFNLGFAVLRYDPDAPVVAAEPDAPAGVAGLTVYPNPVRHTATVRYLAPEAGAIQVAVYDGLGRRVAVLHDGPLAAGAHALALDATALPAGVYVVRATGVGHAAGGAFTVAR